MSLNFSQCVFGYRRGRKVLDGLDLSFDIGYTVLLGPNGAGKSTLLSLGASVYVPQAGAVRVAGLSSRDRKVRAEYRRRVAWLPQVVLPVPGLRAREQVAYAGWLKGLSRTQAWDRAEGALARVDLSTMADTPVRALSGGQLRRVGIAQALVHDARVILMDEPTAGLDPQQRKMFRDVLGGLPEGVDVVVSTHQTEDLTDSYRWVVVLDRGQARFQGEVAGFLALAGTDVEPSRRAEAAYLQLVGAEA
jgi:ABC-type multidrug transport system ATPase subunit